MMNCVWVWMRSGMTGVEISEFSIKERIVWEQYVNVVMSITKFGVHKEGATERKEKKHRTHIGVAHIYIDVHLQYSILGSSMKKKHLSRADRK